MKILTFDIEEWFHILDNPDTQSVSSWSKFESRLDVGVESILELLERSSQKATFFCLGWVAKKYPDVIRKIDRAGYHIGTHSYAHQLVYTQNPQQFRDDLRQSLSVIQDIIGKPVNSYRAPGFSITSENLWAFEILLDEGIEIDCSLFPARRAHGGLPNLLESRPFVGRWDERTLKLFPINTKSILGTRVIYSGGGYFRLLPYFLIQQLFKQDDYVMTYFHPRDFDAQQPIVPGLSTLRRFKSYVGIRGARAKLEKLLNEFRFHDLLEAENNVDWKTTPSIDLHTDIQFAGTHS